MTPESKFGSGPGSVDAERAAGLRRIKLLATLLLAGCVATFVTAKVLQHTHPAFGYLAAFAEAATIGGLADWYAVVALFRRPLGLPIPHTAIIQNNQHRIGEKLGEFIEQHFLDPAPVEAKLRQVDFASFIAEWLNDRKRSADLARFALHLLPEALSSAEPSGLSRYVARRIMTQLQSVNLAPLAAATLRAFVEAGRHRTLFEGLLSAVHSALTRPETVAAFRQKIRDELPTLLKLYRADAFLVKKIMASATAFFEEVRTDPDHPFRGELDRLALSFADRISADPAYGSRLDGLKHDFLARPELADVARSAWSSARSFLEKSAAGESTALQHHLANVFVEAGRALAADAEIGREVNHGVTVVLRSFIAGQKSGVATFIADQVKSWNMTQLILLLEANVGRDLQYIRFNGTLIGGIAGLILYTAEVMLRLAPAFHGS